MARKKTPKSRVSAKAAISSRLREVRLELFGYHGSPVLARQLKIPPRTWYNYENGITVPAEVLLNFISVTGINPAWLLNGEEPKYHQSLEDQVLSSLTPAECIRRGLEQLEQQPQEIVVVAPSSLPGESVSEFVAVGLIPLADLPGWATHPRRIKRHILAFQTWIPHPGRTVAVQLEDDAMAPILPAGSVVAIDCADRVPEDAPGQLFAVEHDRAAVIRFVELSGRHLLLRPIQSSREHPIVPLDWQGSGPGPIIGRVVWSWSRFAQSLKPLEA